MSVLRRIWSWLAGPASPPEPTEGAGGDTTRDEVVTLPIEDAIDLHTFAARDIPSVVEEYLTEAQRLGFAEVRVIHGKGKGVQRAVVRRVAARHPAVESFADAPATRGGWGATVVQLRPRSSGARKSRSSRDGGERGGARGS